MFYLLATTKTFEGTYCACVSYHPHLVDAQIQKDQEELAYSDEGVRYEITEKYPHEAEVTNCEYDLLIERISK